MFLFGSQILKEHNASFREPNDWDIFARLPETISMINSLKERISSSFGVKSRNRICLEIEKVFSVEVFFIEHFTSADLMTLDEKIYATPIGKIRGCTYADAVSRKFGSITSRKSFSKEANLKKHRRDLKCLQFSKKTLTATQKEMIRAMKRENTSRANTVIQQICNFQELINYLESASDVFQ